MLLYKHNKDKLELQWEPGYRIVALPTKWTARIKNKESGEPKRVNVRDLKLKDPAEDWELKAEDMGGEQNVLMTLANYLILTGYLKMTLVTHLTRTKKNLMTYQTNPMIVTK